MPAPDQFNPSTVLVVLRRNGISPGQVDIRVHGSAAHYYTGDNKPFDLEEIDRHEVARERLKEWFGDNGNYPAHHLFDSRYRLGLDTRPSDYDLNISSDAMVALAQAHWDDVMSDRSADDGGRYRCRFRDDQGRVHREVVRATFPALDEWAYSWSEVLGRDVCLDLYPSSGPNDTSDTGVSEHFRDTDWVVHSSAGWSVFETQRQAGMTRVLAVHLVGELREPGLSQLRGALHLTDRGRLSDDEDVEFGRRYLKRADDDHALVTLDRIDPTHWQIQVSYWHEALRDDAAERFRTHAAGAAKQAGLMIECSWTRSGGRRDGG